MNRKIPQLLAVAILTAVTTAAADAQDYRSDRYDPGMYGRAGPNDRYSARAEVLRVRRLDNPYAAYQRQQCWSEHSRRFEDGYYRDRDGRLYRDRQDSNADGAAVGAVIGALIGNQIGDGDGRRAATVAGAAAGAAIGARADERNDWRGGDYNYDYRDNRGEVWRCRTVGHYGDYRRFDGYRVTYRYAGRVHETTTREHPGRYLDIVVDIRPREGGTAYRD